MDIAASRFYSHERNILGEVCPLDTPYRFAISVSEVCNFKCVYCFRSVSDTISSGYTTAPFMSMEMFQRIVCGAKGFPSPIKKIFLNITGEPLCHKELPEMIKYLKSQIPGSSVCIQTNASLLNRGLSERLAGSGLDEMMISLQGMSAEKYRRMCGANINFDTFVDNIRYLYSIKAGLKMYAKMPDIALDENEESKYYDVFGPITDQAVTERINPVFNEVDYSALGIGGSSTANRIGTDYGVQEICSIPFYGLSVTTNGNVYPCVQSIVPCTFGNINDESIVDIWNGKARLDFLKAMLRKESVPRCDVCNSKHACVLSPEDSIGPYADMVLARMTGKDSAAVRRG